MIRNDLLWEFDIPLTRIQYPLLLVGGMELDVRLKVGHVQLVNLRNAVPGTFVTVKLSSVRWMILYHHFLSWMCSKERKWSWIVRKIVRCI